MNISIHNIGSVEAAQILQLPYRTFIDYINTGKISYKLVGRERFYTTAELQRFKREVLEEKAYEHIHTR
jgi:hypothetical protein